MISSELSSLWLSELSDSESCDLFSLSDRSDKSLSNTVFLLPARFSAFFFSRDPALPVSEKDWYWYLAEFCPGYSSKLCSLYGKVLGLCHCAIAQCKIAAFSNCCLYKFSPKHSPVKTKPQSHWSKWWTIKIFWAISNKLLRFWNLNIALVDLEILGKRYITLKCAVKSLSIRGHRGFQDIAIKRT